MKICSKCKVYKPTIEFRKDVRTSDGLYNQCKKCQNLVASISRAKKLEGIIKAF